MTEGLSLPKFQLEADLDEAVEAIRADTASGPMGLARRGAEVVIRLTHKAHYERPLHIWMEVQGLARALLEARADCMPLVNLASETVRPLPELYGRGKDEGSRMRADLRARIEAWLAAVNDRAAHIEAARRSVSGPMVSARAMDAEFVYFEGGEGRLAIAGAEKFVPPNYTFDARTLRRRPLDTFEGVLTGDTDKPVSVDTVRTAIASLRFETILL